MVLNGVSAAAVATVTAIGVATVLPIVAKEAGVVKMPSAAVAATAAEGSKPTSPENDSTEAPVSRCLFSFTRRLVK